MKTVTFQSVKRVTPIVVSDTTTYTPLLDAIYVGTGGDINVVDGKGVTTLFIAVPSGSILPAVASKVNASGTTASNLLGLRFKGGVNPENPVTVSNQTIQFGALTLANAGGAKAIASDNGEVDFIAVTNQGGATRTWSVSGGRLIANGTPAVDNGIVLTCSTSLGTISVTIASSGTDPWGNDLSTSYSVKDGTELEAVATTANLASAARSILCRSGNYTIATSCFLNKAFANRLTITRAQSTKPIIASGCIVENTDNVTFSRVAFYYPYSASAARCLHFKEGSQAIQVYDCEFYSDPFDITARYPSAAPNEVTGIWTNSNHLHSIDIQRCTFEYFNVGINVTASSSIAIDGCTIRAFWEDAIKIAPVTTFPTVTVTDNLIYDQVGNGTDSGSPHCDGIQLSGGSTLAGNWTGVTIERNRVIQTTAGGGNMQAIFARHYSPVTFTVNCSVAFTTSDQTITGGTSGATGKLVSSVAVSGAVTMSLYNVTGTFTAGETLTGASNGSATLTTITKATQGYIVPVIRDNFVICNQVNGIEVASLGNGTIIEGNTVIGKDGVQQEISIGEYGKEAGASVIVRDNVSENISINANVIGGGTEVNNIEMGSSGGVGGVSPNTYGALFDTPGTNFSAPATVDQAMTWYAMKSGGLLNLSPNNVNIGSLGTGYVDYTAGTSDHPRRENGFDASSGSWSQATARQITGISSTGALVTITGTTFDVLSSDGVTVVASAKTTYVVSNNQYVRPNGAGTITVGSTSGSVSGIPTFAFLGSDGSATNIVASGSVTYAGVSLGTAHANRIIIVGFAGGGNPHASVTVAGISATSVSSANSGQTQLWAAAVPTGTTGDIVVTNSSGSAISRHALAWYAGYPASATIVDQVSQTNATTTTPVTLSNLEVSAGGFVVYFSNAGAAGITYETTWSGGDSVVQERGETSDLWEYESALSATTGYILTTTATTTDDLTITPSATSTRHGVAASWGAS